MDSQFAELYRQYDAINAAIRDMLKEANGATPLDADEIARRVMEKLPGLDLGPAALAVTIRHAAKDRGVPIKEAAKQVSRERAREEERPV